VSMGPTSMSQKRRSKRPDGRPVHHKTRAKIGAKEAGAAVIADLRVTRKQKTDRNDRETSRTVNGDFKKDVSSSDKLLRSLRKKLKQIEELLHKQTQGVELDEAQLEKIDSMEDVVAELEEVSASMSAKDSKKR